MFTTTFISRLVFIKSLRVSATFFFFLLRRDLAFAPLSYRTDITDFRLMGSPE